MIRPMRPLLLSLCLVACGPGVVPEAGAPATDTAELAASPRFPVSFHYAFRDELLGVPVCHVTVQMTEEEFQATAARYKWCFITYPTATSGGDIDCTKGCDLATCVIPAYAPAQGCDWVES